MPNLAAANTGKVVLSGSANSLGAHCVDGGVNFSVYSRDAIGMELVLFDDADFSPTHIIPFNQFVNRIYHYWHLFVPGLRTGQT
jgi:isoamylase